MDLAQLPFPYTAEELAEKEAIFYYESSRGCPYRCAYCLSAAETGVRYKPLELVEQDFKTFVDHDVRLVKLVDRTFNSDDERAQKILDIIARLADGQNSTLKCRRKFYPVHLWINWRSYRLEKCGWR